MQGVQVYVHLEANPTSVSRVERCEDSYAIQLGEIGSNVTVFTTRRKLKDLRNQIDELLKNEE